MSTINSYLLEARNRITAARSGLSDINSQPVQIEQENPGTESGATLEEQYQERWENATLEERQEMLTEIYGDIATSLGLDPTNVVFTTFGSGNQLNPALIGLYSRDGNVYIDLADVSSRDFDTMLFYMAHETYHQHQRYLINNPDAAAASGISQEQIDEWAREFNNYIPYGQPGYASQDIESQADDFAEGYRSSFYGNGTANNGGTSSGSEEEPAPTNDTPPANNNGPHRQGRTFVE